MDICLLTNRSCDRSYGLKINGKHLPNKKRPSRQTGACLGVRAWQWPTFTRESALSSALTRFTVLFEMGRSGTTSLWSSGINGCSPCCKSQQSKRIHRIEICIFWLQPTNWHKQLEPQPTQPVFTNSISQYTSQYVSFPWTLLSRLLQAAHNTIKVIGSSLTSN